MSIGFLLLTDAVSSMKRDPVNLEDRIIASVKNWHKGDVFGRMISGKNASNVASIFRRKITEHQNLCVNFDHKFCYMLLGNCEERFGSANMEWFKATVINTVSDVRFAGYEPVLVLSKTFSPPRKTRPRRITNKVVRVPKPIDWFSECKSIFSDVSSAKSVSILECEISCPKQWDTPDAKSIEIISSLISNDIKIKTKPKIKPKKESAVVFSFS